MVDWTRDGRCRWVDWIRIGITAQEHRAEGAWGMGRLPSPSRWPVQCFEVREFDNSTLVSAFPLPAFDLKWKNACQSKSGIKSPTSRLKLQPAMSHVQRRPDGAPPLVPRVAPGLPLFLALVCKCVIRAIDRTLPWIAIPGPYPET